MLLAVPTLSIHLTLVDRVPRRGNGRQLTPWRKLPLRLQLTQAAANRTQAASQGAQSATASIDYHSLVAGMSRLNDDSARNIKKGLQPKWDFKVETFFDWQNTVDIWAESHDIQHLLLHPPVADPVQQRKQVAKRVILLMLPNQDRAHVKGSLTLNKIWSKLLAKYMPSTDAEARRLWSRFSALR